MLMSGAPFRIPTWAGYEVPHTRGISRCVVNKILALRPLVENNPTMTVVAAALFDPDARLILTQLAPHWALAGLWEILCGMVDRKRAALERSVCYSMNPGVVGD